MRELGTLVRLHDYERYLCSLFAASETRPHLWALQAVAYELLRVPASVSEEMAGLVKLKWWQEEIDLTYRTGTHRHPTLEMVGPFILSSPLLPADYHGLIEALAEQISMPYDSKYLKQVLSLYYRLLAKTAGEADALEIYAAEGYMQAHIALCRSFAKQQRYGELEGLLKGGLTRFTLPAGASAYLRALHRLNGVWMDRIESCDARRHASLNRPVPFLALRLASAVILRHK